MDRIISIHAPLTGCDSIDAFESYLADISIHAPLTGCDVTGDVYASKEYNFNPRTPYGMRH